MGKASQQTLTGTRTKAEEQAEYVVELRDKASKAKQKHDEEVQELLGLMKKEKRATIKVEGVTLSYVESEKLKVSGYKKPTVGE